MRSHLAGWQQPLLQRRILFLLVMLFLPGTAGRLMMLGQPRLLVLPSDGELMHHALAVPLGNVGPRLVSHGAIDPDNFARSYEQAGKPLTEAQWGVLQDSAASLPLNEENSYFLLNLLWALGLTNQSSFLESGPMMSQGWEGVMGLASTGGWTLAARPVSELYSSLPIISLTREQEARVERVAGATFRPCCNNSTLFPDCNHGMAMLALLQLLAARDAPEGALMEAAVSASALWFPQQTAQLERYFADAEGITAEQVAPWQWVDRSHFSADGFRAVASRLAQNGLRDVSPDSSDCDI